MISLCMIVKNEEETIEKSLESVKGLVDEIIIVDTGSVDRSKIIARKYTDKVFDFKWNNNFAEARNYALSKVSNEWVLVLDADEIITKYNKESIENFCSKYKETVGRMERTNYYEDKFGVKKYIERVNRFFNVNYFLYEGIIHEQVTCKKKIKYNTENIDIYVDHIGYSKEVIHKTNKITRNIELLKLAIESSKNDPYLYYQLGKSYFMGKSYDNAYKNFSKALVLIREFNYEYIEDLIECYGYSMINLGLYEESMRLYEYEKYYKNSPDYLFLMALIEMNNGNFQRAAETFLSCTKYKLGKVEGVTSFLPLYNIGVIFQCLGFEEEARSYFEMCGEYIPALRRLNELSKKV